jgi:hypothetical protein
MSASPLEHALTWFAQSDDMGGFKTVAAVLFPGWEPKRSCRAPHREDRQQSFSIYRNESGDWRFKDFTGEQGGLVGFVMLAGMDKAAAAHWLMEKAGTPRVHQPIAPSPRPQADIAPRRLEKLPPMPVEAMATWSEGVDYLEANAGAVEKLAAFRGWPPAWAQYLVECAAVSMPLYHGQRTIAFLVATPEARTNPPGGQIIMRDIGFHCRLEPRDGEAKASWRFVPNEKEHRQTTPALPYIIGGSWFDSARLLVITEGQWDALTFAFAAGWLGEGCRWPDGVCLIGIRGASGVSSFLHHYGRFWPGGANCLLLPDGDASGGKWFEGAESFADQLAARCRKVAVVRCAPHKDFNDLHRAMPVTPDQITQLLGSHGMALESGVAA